MSRTTKQLYKDHKDNTIGRIDKHGNPIKFKLSYEEWLRIWEDSGHFNERGLGGYVMGRIDDTGNYEVGNVHIITHAQNNRESTGGFKPNQLHPIIECPHCQKAGNRGMMHRWHLDNCKQRKL